MPSAGIPVRGRGRRGIAPMITALLPGPSMPQVVFLILGGILIGPGSVQLGQSGSDRGAVATRAGVPVPRGWLRTRDAPVQSTAWQARDPFLVRHRRAGTGLRTDRAATAGDRRQCRSDDRADHHRTGDPAADPARERNAEHRAGTVRFRSRCGWRVPADRRDGPAPQRHGSHRRDHRVGRDGESRCSWCCKC